MVTENQIAAYADGELRGDDLAAVEAAIAADPALAAQVAAHRALQNRLSAHFAPVADQPVPAHLAALLEPKAGGNLVSFAAARKKLGLRTQVRRFAPLGLTALAASLALAIVLPRGATPDGYADPRLASALDGQLSGEKGENRILLSFAQADGQFCRAWSGTGQSGIACRDETGWRVERRFARSQLQASEYRQAGANDAQLLEAAQAMAAQGALDAGQEAAARRRGWR